jgi:hypothetical protein
LSNPSRVTLSATRGVGFIVLALVLSLAYADDRVEQRSGFIECGSAQVRALAECIEHSTWCLSETLSFARRAGRIIVPLHARYSDHRVSARKLKAADYVAQSWACVPGRNGGHYLVVVMTRADGPCKDCEYSRLYDLNGRLIATDFAFDAAGRSRPDEDGREMMRQVLGGPGQHRFDTVYR